MLMRKTFIVALVAASALPLLSGCTGTDVGADRSVTSSPAGLARVTSRFAVPAGRHLIVRLTSTVSSENARVGDPWSGIVVRSVSAGNEDLIPARSQVHGIVTGAHGAGRGTRAMLDLAVEEVSIDGGSWPLAAGTEAVIARAPRTDNPGAPAGVVTAGAPVGREVGGDGWDAVAAMLIEGTAMTDAIPAGKGPEVVLDSRTVMVFIVNERPALR